MNNLIQKMPNFYFFLKLIEKTPKQLQPLYLLTCCHLNNRFEFKKQI